MSTRAASQGPGDPAVPLLPRRRGSMRRWVVRLAVVSMVLLLTAELTARFVFGLGDPPLYIRDPEIEYLFRPSARYRYLHNDVSINAFSMRAADFGARKASPDELRILVLGDSIVAGGGRVAQVDLATERLGRALRARLGRPVIVGNASAASWGLPNQLAYVRRFGLFDADVVLLVLNSGDADDVPGLEAVGASYPEHTPILALQEPGRRALQRLSPRLAEALGLLTPADKDERGEFRLGYEKRCEAAAAALSDLARLVSGSGAKLGVIQYWTLDELRRGPADGHARIASRLRALGLPSWQAPDRRAEAVPDPGPDPGWFLPNDQVHPSASGHARLAEIMETAALALLAGEPGDTSAAERPENPPVR